MKQIDRKKLRAVCSVLFVLYIICIVYFLIFSDMFGRGGYDERRYNLHPLQEIQRFITYGDQMSPMSVFLNLYGNIIAFIPFGMLLRWARNKNTTFVQALLYSLGFTLGVFDIDDIIMNTLGGVIGYCIYYVTAKLIRRYHAKK